MISAGVPWYASPFGRDALITGFQALLVNPEIARDALLFLAAHQGKRHDDFREDVVYVDNRPSAALTADKGRSARIHAIGANLVHVVPLGPGAVDGLTYGYGQFGDWQSLTQRAWAYGVEAGYRLTDVWAKPWLRVGINSASGDTNPNDGTHGTFFQMLPTAQLYANFPFYNMMNDQDVRDPAIAKQSSFHLGKRNRVSPVGADGVEFLALGLEHGGHALTVRAQSSSSGGSSRRRAMCARSASSICGSRPGSS